MGPLTLYELRLICPKTPDKVLRPFVEPLNAAFEEFDINTPRRRKDFLAQAAHETGGFQWLKEFANGHAYDAGKLAERLGNTPEEDGDGERYKGRGIFQLTGTKNYRDAGTMVFGDPDLLLYDPDKAGEVTAACRIAGWYWKSNGLNELSDRGDFRAITRRINGGLNGFEERLAYRARAEEALA